MKRDPNAQSGLDATTTTEAAIAAEFREEVESMASDLMQIDTRVENARLRRAERILRELRTAQEALNEVLALLALSADD